MKTIKKVKVYALAVLILFSLPCVFAESFAFNGTIKDIDGGSLSNALINVSIRDSTFSVVGSNSTTSNASGWFNFTVTGPDNGFYQPVITYKNTSFAADVNFTQYTG